MIWSQNNICFLRDICFFFIATFPDLYILSKAKESSQTQTCSIDLNLLAVSLTIGSALDPGAPHNTKGVVRVVGGSIFDFLLFVCTYLLFYFYVCPKTTSILYRTVIHIALSFMAYTHIAYRHI